MIDAIQSRLRTQPPSDTGLLSIAAAKSAATAATNPQTPVADANPKVHASPKEETPAIEIFLADADDQSGLLKTLATLLLAYGSLTLLGYVG